MRVAIFTNNYAPFVGGVPISIERLARGLTSIGHQVTVFAPSYEKFDIYEEHQEDGIDEIPVVRYRSLKKLIGNGNVVGNCLDFKIEKEFLKGEFDIIHVHHPFLIGYTALYLGHKYNVPVVYTYHTRYEQYLHHIKSYGRLVERHEVETHKFLKSIEGNLMEFGTQRLLPFHNRIFMNHCDGVIAPTRMMKELLETQEVDTPIHVLPTGLEAHAYHKESSRCKELREQFIGKRQHLLCHVARLEKEKNIDFVLRGILKLKESMGSTFRLLLIGDGSQREEFEDMVWNYGLEEEVAFVGTIPQEEITNYYGACDAFVFASKSETQGIVLLEAMAAGLPVVAIEASGVSDIVVEGENGYLTEESESKWANQIQLLLQKDSCYNDMCEQARLTASRYHLTEIAQQAIEYYQEVSIRKEVHCEGSKRIKKHRRTKSCQPSSYLLRTGSENIHY